MTKNEITTINSMRVIQNECTIYILIQFLFYNFVVHAVDRYNLQKPNATTFNIAISLNCLTPTLAQGHV
jgi:hypothetical protein